MNPPANEGDITDTESWVWKIPWRRAWQHTPVSLPGKSPWIEEPDGLQFVGSHRSRTWLKRLSTQAHLLDRKTFLKVFNYSCRSLQILLPIECDFCFYLVSSVQFSRSVVSNSLRPHQSQHARPPCPSPTSGVHSDSCPSSQWCHPAISSSVVPFSSCPQSLPASESFPMSQLFAWGGQSTGASALASFLPKKSQGWSPSEWTGWRWKNWAKITWWAGNSWTQSLAFVLDLKACSSPSCLSGCFYPNQSSQTDLKPQCKIQDCEIGHKIHLFKSHLFLITTEVRLCVKGKMLV